MIRRPHMEPSSHINTQFEDLLFFFGEVGVVLGGEGGGDGIACGGSGDGIRRNVPSSSTLILRGLSGFGIASARSSNARPRSFRDRPHESDAAGGTPMTESTEYRLGPDGSTAMLGAESLCLLAKSARDPPVLGELGGVVRCAVTSDANDDVRSKKDEADG